MARKNIYYDGVNMTTEEFDKILKSGKLPVDRLIINGQSMSVNDYQQNFGGGTNAARSGKWEYVGDTLYELDANGNRLVDSGKSLKTGIADGYKYNNILGIQKGSKKEFKELVKWSLENFGAIPTDAEAFGMKQGSGKWKRLQNDLKEFHRKNFENDFEKEKFFSDLAYDVANPGNYGGPGNDPSSRHYVDPVTGERPNEFINPETGRNWQAEAENQFNDEYKDFYRDAMSTERGTLGGDSLHQMTELARTQGRDAGILADTQLQAQALAQAQTVKQITDSVRAERMNRMRAGYSESDIANQDMMAMMTNIGALNDQAAAANMGRLDAHLTQGRAQEEAYSQWMGAMAPIAQGAAAKDAAVVGDVNAQAIRSLDLTVPGWRNAPNKAQLLTLEQQKLSQQMDKDARDAYNAANRVTVKGVE